MTLGRGPYLQQVTETGALVVWRTTTAAACTLAYLSAGGPAEEVSTPAATQHVVALAGLVSDTRYDYTIRSGGLLAGGSDYFVRTAPAAGGGVTTRLLVWGDSGNGSASQAAVAAVLDTATADLALHVGDIIYPSGQASYYDPRYFQPYAPLVRHTPVWAVPGNHDMGEVQAFLDAWYLPTNPVNGSERYYSFDWGDVHCVALDSNQPFTTEILNWVGNDLDASSRRWKFVFFHHTMYSCGSYHGSSSSLIAALGPVFDAHGVDLVFYGHDHHYERSWPLRGGLVVDADMNPDYVDPGGTIYVISGAGGGTRSTGTSCGHTARALAVPSFVRLEIASGTLALEAVDTTGRVIDRMTLTKTGAPPPPPPPPADSVRVLEPAPGTSVTVGSPLTVRWTASPGVASLRLELSRSGAAGPWETLAGSTPNDGEESWTATGPASTDCFVRAVDTTDGVPSDVTDGAFAILAAPDSSGGGGDPIAAVRFNFQPAASAVPAGYTADTGLPFDAGRGWGWAATMWMRERGMLAGDPRDTFVDVTNTATGTWEFAVPNGAYLVSLGCGDAYTSATHRVALEGQVVVQDVYTIGGQFVERTDLPVVVADGRLTMTVGGSGQITHTKVNAIEVTPVEGSAYVLTAPGAGTSLCVGQPLVVRWDGATGSDSVDVELSRAGAAGPWETLLVSTPDDGEEVLDAAGSASSSCVLRLRDAAGNLLAQSPAAFAILEPGITLTCPNGGETWTTGSVQRFEWTSTCLGGDVRLEVSRDGAGGPWAALLDSTPNDGQEIWTVRNPDIGWTHARVVALPAGLPADASDGAFVVMDLPAPPPGVWRIDFAPAGTTAAPGYVLDTGAAYAPAQGSGWNAVQLVKQRGLLPGDCRDTFVQVVNNTTATWSLDLPNGEYRVSLVCGDPFTSGTHRVALEGLVVVADVYAIGGVFVTRDDLPVTVLDGQLSVTLGGSGQITSTKLGCIVVESVTPFVRGPRQPKDVAEDPSGVAGEPDRPGIRLAAGLVHGPAEVALLQRRAGRTRLAVYDVRGRRVALLFDGDLAAGWHSFTWTPVDAAGRRLAPGVYFVRLDAAALTDRRKLVLVR